MVLVSFILGGKAVKEEMNERPEGELMEQNVQGPGKAPADQNGETEKKNTSGEDIYIFFHDLLYILAFVSVFFVFCVRLVTVNGTSMFPTLEHHDQVALLSNVLYRNIKSGDIVVALKPEFDNEPIVKRVIATEGQTVDIDFDQGIVYVDGVALEEDYINERTTRQFYEDGVQFPLTIDKGHVFLMGDNRNNSYDSRYYLIGQVDTRCILGKVLLILFPGESGQYGTKRDFGRIGAP